MSKQLTAGIDLDKLVALLRKPEGVVSRGLMHEAMKQAADFIDLARRAEPSVAADEQALFELAYTNMMQSQCPEGRLLSKEELDAFFKKLPNGDYLTLQTEWKWWRMGRAALARAPLPAKGDERRTLAPLTNERIIEIADRTRTAESRDGDYILPISFARAIEAALEESAPTASHDTQGEKNV